ncbi:MAG TPA: PA0069 family radical SAM protein [Phenylobacterium sp.]|uniref:PA0069 family radical SAM protein n=1 Tax=Phenylobacterium sp. TaxID=1871053 RepID=UPI002B481EEB|nr:PA0069 family radical SAM protein [Phenylobacterium sp.]HKR24719.1 PA0069 family radical SAM protein [Allosphingosinicella sp.]HKR87661.1 PA0069 family radical SAM protein [Phenylobacterium sp.]
MPARGRGAKSNRTGRFESLAREAFDDGWLDEQGPQQIDTIVAPMKSRTIIAKNNSPDVGFSRSINPYRGCSHGCIYCYARPAHAYLGLSPGLDFETKIFFKPQAARLLEAELSRPSYRPDVIHIGGDTDPYQPDEKRLRVTREVLETLQRFNHPFSIITKSALIQRDLDILADMGGRRLARAAVSVTTLDRRLARSMEPRAATPERRLETIRALAEAGVPTIVMFAPVIPGLNDAELEAVLEKAAAAGAVGAGYVTLRLPLEIKDIFEEWLQADHADRARRVMSIVRQMRGGMAYRSDWGKRMTGEGPVAEILKQRFQLARRRYGLDRKLASLDLCAFSKPAGDPAQLLLF